ncbi:MAG: ABC transporter ATP-binding protein [Deltaproteobacteria bacterium]|nr:ABC transporter ATP-binding protein [Deltaproteobacteria bacterium]MBI2341939.1 ABC transporter ATP-binding protein [Deltaproteobacteria bacterium]
MQLDSITKNFGAFTALDNVSTTFDAGKIYILAGPNGAGKTTLLRIIAGLLRPTSGKVVFTKIPKHQRTNTLGVMMQESYLYRDLTPRENLELYVSLYGVPCEQVSAVKQLLNLEPFFDHDVGTLSHGQRQRTSLARALLPNPKTLLLDEPFLGLDTSSVAHVQKFLAGFKENGGLALIATHELELVREIAGGLMLLDGGKIKYFGEFNV